MVTPLAPVGSVPLQTGGGIDGVFVLGLLLVLILPIVAVLVIVYVVGEQTPDEERIERVEVAVEDLDATVDRLRERVASLEESGDPPVAGAGTDPTGQNDEDD